MERSTQPQSLVVDGNEAAARVAHKLAEVIAIYPITPASPMGELADAWSAADDRNLWGQVPEIVEMQSEAGAAGAVHGALQGGALATTFTASQGLLLMLPEMFKIAGELQPCVFHVAARAVAGHALSIFGDHSDVYAARPTGFAILAGASVQEAQDMAALAFMTSLESRVPFLHFFDGFRTSHEINVIDALSDEDLGALVDEEQVTAFKQRALSPDRPSLRGSAQNPDVFFQGREAAGPFYEAVPRLLEEAMLRFARRTGRSYQPFEYVGHPRAERVVVAMGSATATLEAAVQRLNREGEPVGLVKVRLYRPFSSRHLAAVLPFSTRAVAVLDRAKDSAAVGEPLYEDVVSALHEEGRLPHTVIGGRYGLGSKEFTPAMACAVFDELARAEEHDAEHVHRDLDVGPHRHFTVGIDDDVSGTSVPYDPTWRVPRQDVSCLFYGLGSDGTVGANKNSAKIIADEAGRYVQAYFVYDSKKSGAVTVSHLRFGDDPIDAPYLIEEADFVACHQFQLLERLDVLEHARPGATFLLSSAHGLDTWRRLPRGVQEQIVAKQLRLYVVDAKRVAREAGLAGRVNTVLQTCFFALSGVLPEGEAIAAIKRAIEKSYGRKGEEMVRRNFEAVDGALAALQKIEPGELNGSVALDLHADAPPVLRAMLTGHGDELPVSAFDPGGVFPTGTAHYERRALADELPVWDPSICIDCAKCVLVCPHAAIRMKVVEPELLAHAPVALESKPWRGRDLPGKQLVIAVSPLDCTGCKLCATACPAFSKTDPGHRSLEMRPAEDEQKQALEQWDFFRSLPELDRTLVETASIKGSQLLEPLFEFSGACSGCGETPYLKLLTQLVGDRLLVANATGCSSIYGGNLPTTPWARNADGRGPAWANSLFEDNAEFGLGLRLSLDQQRREALVLLERLDLPTALKQGLREPQPDEAALQRARKLVAELKSLLAARKDPSSRRLLLLSDALVEKSVWLVGGDGWAYDIGFGGLDHVLASGRNVKVLVLDTEVYSNTGGQASKATPRGAVAKFASAGKRTRKKDLGLIAMGYGDVYVAQIALGGDNAQAVRALWEAEQYPGSALVIAYSHCIEHGIEMGEGMLHQKDAVETGYWPLYRYDPRNEKPLRLDSKRKRPVSDFLAEENRFASLQRSRPETAAELDGLEQADVDEHWGHLELMLAAQEAGGGRTSIGKE
ncbi:MAG TPA: pyruvate:ferredoxin (flavodoxin) oxidoreductase [Gaiellaceae bacterium]|nr:pyruvate:ferredoxin (flavodoxin) oxidoreductase [Gaiellaceae bacterium]